MENLKLTTERLEIVSGTAELFEAKVGDRATLGHYLQAQVPASWPPEHYDQEAVDYTAEYLADNPDAAEWTVWFLVRRAADAAEDATAERTVIGTCGFKGKPTSEGTVEIGYSVLAEFQRAGYATEAVGKLVEWAFSHRQVNRVIAETYPELVGSIRVLEKNKFKHIGAGSEEGVIRFELTRAEYENAAPHTDG